jgi:hypothetical protein
MSLADLIPLTPAELKQRIPLAYVCATLGIILNDDLTALCPFHAESNPSFHLWLADSGEERWHCFPCNGGGDMFSLIQRVERTSFPEALDRAREMLTVLPRAGYQPLPKAPPVSIHSQAYEIDQARWHAREIGKWNAYVRDVWGLGIDQHGTIYFPHWDTEGNLTGCKLRFLDGSKKSLRGSRYTDLYGSWLDRHYADALLCEGESDAVFAATQDRHVDVFALPRGAGSDVLSGWVEHVGDGLVYLAFDGDAAGRAATARWMEKLPGARVLPIPEGHDLRSAGIPLDQLFSMST